MSYPNMFQRLTLAHPNQILHEDPPFPWAAWRPSNPHPSSTTAPQPSWANAPTSSTTAWTVSDRVVCARRSFCAAHTTHSPPTLLAMPHSLVLNSPTLFSTNPHTGKYTHTHARAHARYFNLWMAFRVVMVTDQQWLTWIISPAGDQTPKTRSKGTVNVDSKGGLAEHVARMLGTLMYAPLSHCASLPSCLYEGFGEKPMFSGYINSWWAWHHSVRSSESFFFTPYWVFR